MIKYMWKSACTALLFLGLLISSCKNDGIDMGGHLVDSHIRLELIDTVSIKVFNMVSVDSVVTSGNLSFANGVGFSGTYHDPQIGTVQTQTYIEFSNTKDVEDNKYARFDSATLVFLPNGNYYGDTVKRASFKISKLVNQIKTQEDGYLYSTSTMPVGEQLIDTALKIKVREKKEFEIRLPQSFGEWLFQGTLNKDEIFNTDNFLKNFPGLSISAGAGSDCVHGLNIQDTACMIRIYYHVNSTQREDKTMTFKAYPYNSFYHLTNDKSKLPPYTSKSAPMPSSETDAKGVIMSGTPMFTRLAFPYLNELQAIGQIVKIKKAMLYVRPVQNSFDTIPLPPRLNVYYFDPTSNKPLGEPLRASGDAGSQDGGLRVDYQNIQKPDFPQYSFNITDFISGQLGAVGHNKGELCLLIPETLHSNTIQRLVFGDQNFKYKGENQSKDNQIRLEITYMVYND